MTELLPLLVYRGLISEEGRPELFRNIRDISIRNDGWLLGNLARPIVESHITDIYSESDRLLRELLKIIPIWGLSKTVYRFDPDLVNELGITDINEYIPIEVFNYLPDYCPFIECRIPLKGFPFPIIAEGFFVTRAAARSFRSLRICILSRSTSGNMLCFAQTMTIPLDENLTIKEALASFMADDIGGNMLFEDACEFLKTITPLILYLCSIGAEIQFRTSDERRATRIQGALPEKPRIADVGLRIGSAIRRYRIERAKQEVEASKTGRTLSPHVRRAHWHHFWTGPMHESRTLILKWIPPIPVNLDKAELPVTIRPVKA
jgi:hypothetical protein